VKITETINLLATELRKARSLQGATIAEIGNAVEIPQVVKDGYVNILPRSKSRERVFYIGGTIKQYNVEPELEVHVWQSSVDGPGDACDLAEELAENVQDEINALSPSEIGVLWIESEIDDYDQGYYEGVFYYVVIVAVKMRVEKNY
jgi:hypothetical protein